jgi:hypothetical protein
MRLARLAAPATLTLALLAVPLAAEAQPTGNVYRIGYLGATTASGTYIRSVEAFRLGLRDLGYLEGKRSGRVCTDAGARGLVAAGADPGPGSDDEPAPAVRATRVSSRRKGPEDVAALTLTRLAREA